MESEENRNDPPQDASMPGGRNPFKLVLGILLALVPGISIVLILNVLNRSGWFSLLSGLCGMLLYSLLFFVKWISGRSLVQWISGRSLGPKTPPHSQGLVGPEAREAFLAIVWPGLLCYGPLALAAGVGLFFLPDQQSPLFALISGALGLLLCISVFRFGMLIGLSILVLFLAERVTRWFAPHLDERDTEVGERAP